MPTNIYSLLFICIICIGGEQSPCKLIVLAPSKISEIYTKKHVLFAAQCVCAGGEYDQLARRLFAADANDADEK